MIDVRPTGGPSGTVLLPWDAYPLPATLGLEKGNYLIQHVTGILGVDGNGCFVLGDRLLIEAPTGSSIVDDGTGIRIRQVGLRGNTPPRTAETVHVGDTMTVVARPGRIPDRYRRQQDERTCMVDDSPGHSMPLLRLATAVRTEALDTAGEN